MDQSYQIEQNVSNLTQSRATGSVSAARWTSFTTGGTASDRYRLLDVEIAVNRHANRLDAEIWSNSGGNPGSRFGHADLTHTGTKWRDYRKAEVFAPSYMVLNGATTYWLRIAEASTGPDPEFALATTDNQTLSGDTGWVIGNNTVRHTAGTTYVQASANSIAFRVNVTPIPITRAVTNFSARPGNGQVTLSWAPVTGATFYEYRYTYRRGGDTGSWNDYGWIGVEPQVASPHVTNRGQTTHATHLTANSAASLANSFTTGGASGDRFTLNSVGVHFDIFASNATVSIHSNGSGNVPGTRIGSALAQRGADLSGWIPFDASGVVLNGNTTYWLVISTTISSSDTANQPGVETTASNAEDGSSASGWSIGNSSYSGSGSTWSQTTGARALKFRVNAQAHVAATVTGLTNDTRYTFQARAHTPNAARGVTDLACHPHKTEVLTGEGIITTVTYSDPACYIWENAVSATPSTSAGQINLPPPESPGDTSPRFTSDAAFSVAENQTAVTKVTAVDDDPLDTGAPPTFWLAEDSGADSAKFSITSAGVLTFKAAPDFENPTDAASFDPVDDAGNNRYIVYVAATSGDGERRRSAYQAVTVTVTDVDEAATAPDPVSNISVTHNGRSLSVSWDASARATGYDVTYLGGGVNARAAWSRAGTTLTITCDSRPGYQNCVSPGTAYTVGVRAKNDAGESEWRNSAQTPLPSPPGAVSNISVTHNGSSLTVTWDASARATGYDVTYNGGGVNARAAWNRAGTSLTITCDSRDGTNCVSSGTTYTVGVRALNAGGESEWVNSASASHSEGD